MASALTTVLLLLQVVTPNVTASDQGQDAEQTETQPCGDLAQSQVSEDDYLEIVDDGQSGPVAIDRSDIAAKVEAGVLLHGQIGDHRFSFKLSEGDMGLDETNVIGADGRLDERATESVRATKVFTGTDLTGVDEVISMISAEWISLHLTFAGIRYTIAPSEDSGIAFEYTLTSNSDAPCILLSGDAVLPESPSPSIEGANVHDEVCAWNNATVASDPSSDRISAETSAVALSYGNNESIQGKAATTSVITSVEARIVLASDKQFRDTKGGSWASLILDPLWVINVYYTNQVGVDFLPVAIVAVPDGQCTSTNAQTLLSQFHTFMDSTYPEPTTWRRDLSHLCTGKWLDNGVLGCSYEGTVNTDRYWGTSWDTSYEFGLSYTCSIFHEQNEWVLGHEIGHTFNGDHQYSGFLPNLHLSWMNPDAIPMLCDFQFTTSNANRIRSMAQETINAYRTINDVTSSTSPQNLQASRLCVLGEPVYRVGGQITVNYQLKNVGTSTITLNYVFVGARDQSGNNRDFGYVYSVVITPGSTFSYSWTGTVAQVSGTWTMWPAYNYQGGWGPYKWITVSPTFYYRLGSGAFAKDTSGAQFTIFWGYNWAIYSLQNVPVVGSTVWARFSLFNSHSGSSSDHLDNLFVGCRRGTTNKDFGSVGAPDLTQMASTNTVGEGRLVWASRTIDGVGTWQFWPAYYYQGGYGPYQWDMLSISVTS